MQQPDPTFPPLLRGIDIDGEPGAFERACADAADGGAVAGDIYWGRTADVCTLAVVLEPEVAAVRSLQMLFVLMVGLGDAFGSIAPPEVGMFYRWPLGLVINDALVGRMRAALPASAKPEDVPGRLVVGFDIRIRRTAHDVEPGHDLDRTTLEDEGCGDITRTALIESASRHFLVWVHTWNEDGFRPVHDAWLPRGEGYDKDVTVNHGGAEHKGRFVGIDDEGNMLLQPGEGDPVSLSLIDSVERF